MPDPYHFVRRYQSYPSDITMIAILILLISACMNPSPKKDAAPTMDSDNQVADTVVKSVSDEKDLQTVAIDEASLPKVETQNAIFDHRLEKDQVSGKGGSSSNEDTSTDQDILEDDVEWVEVEIDSPQVEDELNEEEEIEAFDHTRWNDLLKNHVSSSGQVDYKGLKSKEGQLDQYLDHLSQSIPEKQTSRAEAMAYWINAYNAFTVKLILKNYPVSSIMNLYGGKAWDVKWIELGGQSFSLNQIEHEILRKKYPDPRIHFAVNCAAASCPPLLNRAWTADNLERDLESQTKSFINDARFNQLEKGRVRLSKIFDWYKGDFGDLVAYIQGYSSIEIGQEAKVRFNEYDWKLNGK